VPEYINTLVERAVHKIDDPSILNRHFKAEACIANLYYRKSTLSAHTDHSEPNHSQPVISYSIGLPAVFLIGGTTRNFSPTAVLLRPGDLVVMAKESRLAYHAVPKIITHAEYPEFCHNYQRLDLAPAGVLDSSDVQDDILQFLNSSRVNINIRQVH